MFKFNFSKKSLNRKLYKRWVRFKDRFSFLDKMVAPKFELTETQILAIQIFEAAIHKKDTELLLAPISQTIYIQTKEIFIILSGSDLKIINGKYQYEIYIPSPKSFDLYDKFKRVLEHRRKMMEATILAKTKRSLSAILEEVKISPDEE